MTTNGLTNYHKYFHCIVQIKHLWSFTGLFMAIRVKNKTHEIVACLTYIAVNGPRMIINTFFVHVLAALNPFNPRNPRVKNPCERNVCSIMLTATLAVAP